MAAGLTLAEAIPQFGVLDLPTPQWPTTICFETSTEVWYVRLTALRLTKFCSEPAKNVICLEHALTCHVSILFQGWTIV